MIFGIIFFMAKVRGRVRVSITCHSYVFYGKSHSFTFISLSNLTVRYRLVRVHAIFTVGNPFF